MAASTHSFNFAGPHHKQRHAAGGEDEITPADIGAVAEDDPRIGDAGALLEAATTAAVNANYAASTATAAAERAESAEAAAFAEPDEAVAAMVENTTSDTRGAIDGLIDAAVPDLTGYPTREEVADGYIAADEADQDVSGLIGDEQSQTRQALDQRLAAEYPSKGEVAATYLTRAEAPTVHTGTFTLEVVNDFRATGTYSFPEGLFAPDGHTPVVAVTPETQFYSASAVNVSHGGVTITVRRIRDDNIRSYTVPVQVVAVQAPDLDPADPQQAETLAARLADLRVEVDKLAASSGNHAARIGELEATSAPLAAIENLSARAVTLPAGVLATAEVTGPTTAKVINLGLPRGADGPPGRDGVGAEEGAELVSQAEAAATAAQNAHTVSEAARDAAEAAAQSASTAAVDAAAIAAPQAAQEAADSIRDNLAEDISTPGNPAYEALVDVAGDIGDPQTAGLIGDPDSQTRGALDTLLEGVAVDDSDVAGLIAATDSSTRAALDALLDGVSAKDPDIAGYVTDAESATRAAIETTVGASFMRKGSIVVNAADHGVIGDGATDDKIAFQAAMAAAAPGGTVLIPAGATMAIPGATNIAAGVTISAHGATIQKIGSSSGWWLRLGDGTRIEGARIDPAGLVTNSVVDASGRTGAALTDCTITGAADAINAVYLSETTRATVRGCTVDGAANGIRINGAAHELTVTGNTVRNWRVRGIHTLGTDTGALDGAVFSGNRIIDFDGSIKFNESGHVGQPFPIQAGTMPHRNVHVLHNIVVGNDRAEEDLELSGVAGCISMHNVHGGVVTGNYCADGGEDAYTFSLGSKNLTVTGNVAIRMDGPGFHLRARSSTYTGNIAINCGQDRAGTKTNPHSKSGYWLSGVHNEMSGCTFTGNAAIDDQTTRTMTYGVVIRDTQNTTFDGNTFRGLVQNYVIDSSSSTHADLQWGAATTSATPLEDEHITLDAQPGWSGTEIKLWRRGGTVILSLRFRPASGTTSGATLLQLPEGWRPPSVVRAGAVSSNDEGANININGSGNVTVSWGTQPTGFLQASIPIPL